MRRVVSATVLLRPATLRLPLRHHSTSSGVLGTSAHNRLTFRVAAGTCAAAAIAYSAFSTMQGVAGAALSPPVALNKDEFKSFPLIEVEQLTPNTKRLRFGLPTKDHVLGLSVASCIVTKANIGKCSSSSSFFAVPLAGGSHRLCSGEGEKPVIRPYTPVTNDKTHKGYFDLIIKAHKHCLSVCLSVSLSVYAST